MKDVRKAYHAKCKVLHPDVNVSIDAIEKMQHVNEAYKTLCDMYLYEKYPKNEAVKEATYDGDFDLGDLNDFKFAGKKESEHGWRNIICAFLLGFILKLLINSFI